MAKVTVQEAHALPLAPALARGRPVQPGPVPRLGRPTPKTQNTVRQLTAKSKRKDTRPPRSATSFNRHRAGAPSSTTVAPLRFRAGGNAKPRLKHLHGPASWLSARGWPLACRRAASQPVNSACRTPIHSLCLHVGCRASFLRSDDEIGILSLIGIL
jgi:hypothetical protein